MATEDSYPYVSGKTRHANKKCDYDPATSAATVSEIKRLPKYDTESMLNVVGNIGPLAVSIDASGKPFHHYQSGIYNNPKCSDEKLSHAVLIVGYGTDTTNSTGLGNVDYWIVKNSWGTSWGDNVR